MKAIVALVKCPDYEQANVMRAVNEAMELLGGIGSFVGRGQTVLLKPNLLSARPPESAIDTHPAVVEAVGRVVLEAGGICSLGDSPATGINTAEAYARMLETTGMKEVIDRLGLNIVRFDDTCIERESPNAQTFRRILLTNAISQHDVIINLPKLKTHALTTITCGIKNLYGCVPGDKKIEFHLQAGNNPELFAQILVNILAIVRPQVTIADGIIGMDGQGPNAGRRRKFGIILASADPVALDAVVCRIVGIDPMSVSMIRLASEQGLGIGDLGQIEVVGTRLEDALISDFQLAPHADILNRMPKSLHRLLRNHMVSRPTVIKDRCTLCRRCAKACPVNAIGSEDKKVRFDYSICIRCYCCQEVCPREAIELRMSNLRWMFSGAISAQWKVKHCVKAVIRTMRGMR